MSTIDVRHLRWFASIADAGSISEASRLLHVAQPALSRQMAALERRTGRRLLERTTKGSALTDDGRRFLVGARKVLAAYDELLPLTDSEPRSAVDTGPLTVEPALDPDDGRGGDRLLRLGVQADAPPSTADLIRAFGRARATDRWRITRTHEADLRGMLMAGQLDAAVMWVPPPDARVASAVIAQVRLLLAVPDAPAWPQDGPVRRAELVRYRFALYPRTEDELGYDHWSRLIAGAAHEQVEFVHVPVRENAQDEMLRAVAEDGLITVVSEPHWTASPRVGVQVREFDPPLVVPLHLFWRADRPSAWIADLVSTL